MGQIEGSTAAFAAVVEQMASWSDEQVLAEIAAFEPLPDESDPKWNDEAFWLNVDRFLGLAEVARLRRLRPAVRLILERASYGDPGEIMRGLRHVFEAIYDPDWKSLADEYLALAHTKRLGTRLWTLSCLTVLDDPRAIPVFEASVKDDPAEIRWEAELGLKRLLRLDQFS